MDVANCKAGARFVNFAFRTIIRAMIPIAVRRAILRARRKLIEESYRLFQPRWTARTIERLRRQPRIKVAFLLITDTVWKYDELYRLMATGTRFEPIVVVCPWARYEGISDQALQRAIAFCEQRAYHYSVPFDPDTGRWQDIRRTLRPDIVFFTYPNDFSMRQYRIYRFLKNQLTCYAAYGFHIDRQQQRQFNSLFLNLVWRSFCETLGHKVLAEKYANNRGGNVVVAGYPLFDEMKRLRETDGVRDVWKIKDRRAKRLIWAPHHTVDDLPEETHFSCFLLLATFMLEIAKKYEGRLQIAFKPHPKLKPKLYGMDGWGKEKTDAYFRRWSELKNGQLEEGDYVHLFLMSDAMVLDSISFMCEYMYTGHPLLFTLRSSQVEPAFNEFGNTVYRCIYRSGSLLELEQYIQDTVLDGKDPMRSLRDEFVRDALLPPDNDSSSQRILDHLRAAVSM